MSTTRNTPAYGLFYKSRGVFTGPYRNRLYTLPQAQTAKAQAKRTLKSVVLVRKVVAA
jgi:hypothetical protein